MVLSRLDAKN